MRITVVGLGYVGGVVAAGFANAGHQVLGVDVDRRKVLSFKEGAVPFYEPGLAELIEKGLRAGTLQFCHPDEVDKLWEGVIFITVGTPSQPYGGTDLSQVYAAIRWIKERNCGHSVIVMKSTVPPGTGIRLIEEELSQTELTYVANPEFLREGQAIHDWFNPSRIIIGARDKDSAELVKALYQNIKAPILLTDITTAEMIKYAANAFLATKISFINEIANLCDRVGANIDEVSQGIGLDPRIGTAFLRAGLGYGGSCFPKDVRALEFLSSLLGCNLELLRAVINVNTKQRLLPIQRLFELFPSLKNVEVAVLGLAFKPNTSDVREAPALDIVRLLVELGASVRAFDPQAMEAARPFLPAQVKMPSSIMETLKGAQAVVLVTEWPEFIELPWKEVAKVLVKPRAIFDGRNALDKEKLLSLGFLYCGVGRQGGWIKPER